MSYFLNRETTSWKLSGKSEIKVFKQFGQQFLYCLRVGISKVLWGEAFKSINPSMTIAEIAADKCISVAKMWS